MRVVVLESPYAATTERTIEQNEQYARRCMRDSIRRGEAPIASHLLYTQPGILDENNPTERSLGIAMGFFWGRYAQAAVFYTNYGMSNGMRRAKEFYEREDIECEIRTLD